MNFKRISSLVIAILLPVLGVFCLITPVLATEAHSGMAACVPPPACSESPFQHIGMWQAMFQAAPQVASMVSILLLAVVLLIARPFARHVHRAEASSAYPAPPVEVWDAVTDFLQEALSRGIIHPRRYAFAFSR